MIDGIAQKLIGVMENRCWLDRKGGGGIIIIRLQSIELQNKTLEIPEGNTEQKASDPKINGRG